MFNKFISEDDSVVIITIVNDGSVDLTFRKSFEEVVVKPLSEGREFSSQLNDFLSDDATPEGVARRNLSISEVRDVFDEFIINTFNLESSPSISIFESR